MINELAEQLAWAVAFCAGIVFLSIFQIVKIARQETNNSTWGKQFETVCASGALGGLVSIVWCWSNGLVAEDTKARLAIGVIVAIISVVVLTVKAYQDGKTKQFDTALVSYILCMSGAAGCITVLLLKVLP